MRNTTDPIGTPAAGVLIVEDYEELSRRAADVVEAAVRRKPNLRLGLSTGNTPVGLYGRLVRAHRDEGLDFSGVVTFNLDEYVGLAPDHPCSYHRFMQEKLFDHVNIPPNNIHIPDGLADSSHEEAARYERLISESGGIDLMIVGIGRNGHIGFNEPGTSLASPAHVALLSRRTIRDNARYFSDAEEVPPLAVTMGVGTIVRARRCMLLASGSHKADAVRAALEGPVTASVPASALQMHPNTVGILDREAAAGLEKLDYYRRRQEQLPLPPEQP